MHTRKDDHMDEIKATDLSGEDRYMDSGEIACSTPKIFPALLEALR